MKFRGCRGGLPELSRTSSFVLLYGNIQRLVSISHPLSFPPLSLLWYDETWDNTSTIDCWLESVIIIICSIHLTIKVWYTLLGLSLALQLLLWALQTMCTQVHAFTVKIAALILSKCYKCVMLSTVHRLIWWKPIVWWRVQMYPFLHVATLRVANSNSKTAWA